MIATNILDIRIFGSDDGWETVFEKSYNYNLFKNTKEREACAEKTDSEIRAFVANNKFLLSQDEEDRDFFMFIALRANSLACHQLADLDIRFHEKQKVLCVRIFSPVFMLIDEDIVHLRIISRFSSYMEIEAIDDEEKRSCLTAAVFFADPTDTPVKRFLNMIPEE